jgi:glycosyltransferase involved in cell wall biosynthesis
VASIIPHRRTQVWRNRGSGKRPDEDAGRTGRHLFQDELEATTQSVSPEARPDSASSPSTARCKPASREAVETTTRPRLPTISVVIPALNEARNLPHVLGSLPLSIHEVVLVDGCSTDGTVEVAREHYPDIRIVGQTARGKGNALTCGFQSARGDIIVMLDADGSADPSEIGDFIRALTHGADFAKGSRFLDGGGSSDLTPLRRLGNACLVLLVNVLYGTRYSDLCYGYNAFWADCLPYLDVDCDGFEVETLLNIRAARAGLCVREVPSFERDRIYGESNLRAIRDGLRILRTIFREFVRTKRKLEAAGRREQVRASQTPHPGS